MADGTKVRLVRCPKCENLLPELPDLPVYQCGGCGAVLQAKTLPTSSVDGHLGKSDEERGLGGSEKVGRFDKKGVSVSDSLEVSDRESNGIKKIRQRRGDSSSSSSSRSESKAVVNENKNENVEVFRNEGKSVEEGIRIGGKYRRRGHSKDPVDNWVIGKDQENQDKSVKVDMERENGELEPQMGVASTSRRSRQMPYWRSRERDGSTAYRRPPRAVSEGMRVSNLPYPDEGPSNFSGGSVYGYGEPVKNHNNSSGSEKVEHLEQDRAELLRKLDELKDQLSRSCEVSDKLKERVLEDGRAVPLDSYGGHDTRFSEGSSRSHGPLVQPFAADKHAQRPLYSNQGIEPIPLMNRRGMDMQNFYPPPMHASNEIPGYGDPYAPRVLGNNRPPHQYPHQPSHDYFPEHYMDMEPDHIASYPHNTFFHQPACSCLRCYHNHLQLSAQVPPGVFNNRRFADAPTNPLLYNLETRGSFVPRGYNPTEANYPLAHSREAQPVVRMQRDLDPEINRAFGQTHLRRVPLARRNGRRCLPIAGGAPFITCHNCFELLPLRRKLLLKEKNRRKLRCGACSTIISFLVDGKKILVSIPAQNKEIPSAAKDGSAEMLRDDASHNSHANQSGRYSDDYESGYCFQPTDAEHASSSMDQRANLSGSEKTHGIVSPCSISSEDEESPDNVIVRKETTSIAKQPLGSSATPLPGSPINKRIENSSSDQVVSKFGKGNRSKRTSQEEVVTKITSRQNSVKDVSMATEMEVSFNEYSNADMSQDSLDTSREEERSKSSKSSDSFFMGLFKKGFRDLSRSNQAAEIERSNIVVNGHPIPERLVKKAEKQAGPIHPGNYWYDFQAGFWGVMGHPCLGIIPPFIEEFNYPMPKNCADGNTGVYVNGRELHQKDLDLLVNRGLPTEGDKSYIIEISGRVVDEDSGEELDSLGKLAPTIEKVKHGFGMRVPRAAAA